MQIVRDPSRRDLSVTNGISCMGCHDQGMRKAKDEVRGAILADKSFSKDERETVEALYPETAKMDAMIEDDFQRFNSAMKRAGLDPTLKLNGVEMTNALYRRYEDDLSLRRAAAEYGYEPEPFKEAFIQGGAGSHRADASAGAGHRATGPVRGPLLEVRRDDHRGPRDRHLEARGRHEGRRDHHAAGEDDLRPAS